MTAFLCNIKSYLTSPETSEGEKTCGSAGRHYFHPIPLPSPGTSADRKITMSSPQKWTHQRDVIERALARYKINFNHGVCISTVSSCPAIRSPTITQGINAQWIQDLHTHAVPSEITHTTPGYSCFQSTYNHTCNNSTFNPCATDL